MLSVDKFVFPNAPFIENTTALISSLTSMDPDPVQAPPPVRMTVSFYKHVFFQYALSPPLPHKQTLYTPFFFLFDIYMSVYKVTL